MKKIKGYNIVKEKTNELLVSIEIGNDEIIERDGYKVIPFYEEGNPAIEQNSGENQIEGGVVSISGSAKVYTCNDCLRHGFCYLAKERKGKACLKISLYEETEKQYQPFKDCDELVKCWEKKTFIPATEDTKHKLYRPSIWVKSKEYGVELMITGFDNKAGSVPCVFLEDMWKDMNTLFNDFTFLDGSPCGVEE